jgi:rieske iron-sulfur protein
MREDRDDNTERAARRAFLQALVAMGGAILVARQSAAADEANPGSEKRPQPGDVLVFSEGEREGAIVAAADVKSGGEPILAWPMDPQSKLVRDGSRLNQVLLIWLDPGEVDQETAPRAAEGIVAYSAICTHAGCPVTGWVEGQEQRTYVLKCFCHNSEFDPRRQASVVFGPAPRHLAALPITVANGAIVVAGSFVGKVGAAQPA